MWNKGMDCYNLGKILYKFLFCYYFENSDIKSLLRDKGLRNFSLVFII